MRTPANYSKAIQSAKGLEAKAAVAVELYEELLQKYPASDRPGELTRTGLNKLTNYNKVIRKIEPLVDGENAFQFKKVDGAVELRHIHFRETTCKQSYGQINAAFQTATIDRITNPAKVYIARYVDALIDSLESEDAYEMSAGLIAASGRREIEIWRLGSFKAIDGKPYSVSFKGQAKRKDYGLPDSEKPSYEINLLIPADKFLKLWREFKRTDAYKDVQQVLKEEEARKVSKETANEKQSRLNQKFHSSRGRSIDRAVKRIFPAKCFENLDAIKQGQQVSAHILRHATVNAIVERDCEQKTTGARLLMAAQQLGHYIEGEDRLSDVLTSLGYINFEVVGEVPDLNEAFKISTVQVRQHDKDAFLEYGERVKVENQRELFRWVLSQAERADELKRQLKAAQAEIQRLKSSKPEPVQTEAIEQPTGLPKSVKGRKLTEEKAGVIAECFWAIAEHNELQTEQNQKWYIGVRSLCDLSGKHYGVAKRWLEENQQKVDEHNERHELGKFHNRTHGRKGIVITDVINAGKVQAA